MTFEHDVLELGERVALAIEDEELGYGPLFDAQASAYFHAEAAMAVLYEAWWGQPTWALYVPADGELF